MDLIKAIANSVKLPRASEFETAELISPVKTGLSFSGNQFASGLQQASSFIGTSPLSANVLEVQSQNKPIFQLNQLPVSLDPDAYKDARSGSNPNGDLKPLFAFRQLVDPVPKFDQNYFASPYSTEMLYANFLNGASILRNDPFVSSVIANARKQFEEEFFQDMDGTSGDWRPVYASPEDWATADISRFSEVSVDLNNSSEDGLFGTIQGKENLKWNLGGQMVSTLNPKTEIKSLDMKYLFVEFRRPWFNLLFFKMNQWYLSGQQAGFCSSGSSKVNDGALPLIPTGMLIARDVKLNANWHQDDKTIMDKSLANSATAYLGPFLMSGPASNKSSIQIIAWVSEVIPLSPKVDAP
ncbi:hypothetical protein EO244_11735 [Ancylomarina salipaludis]|uniref:Uncharacterized protein n=1 Tax=Ancylomarina salipaludis TaxID=2501299 RepID=A0A4Q1JJY1_9BACT|nr:hypothetical protein [Ancylomarina salipaludis]RXQ92213.1 hypothetical protein EO244_11735 [Ancylomarina salipaludis]